MNITLGPEGVGRCIEEVGFGFMFAQTFHPAMRFAAGPRREIGIRTIFNTLGPLMNPAGVTAQVFGMADPSLAETVAQFLHAQGVAHALIVHGQDGLDEISLAAPTDVWDLQGGAVSAYTVTQDDFGLGSVDVDSLRVDSPAESAATVRSVLAGEPGPAPRRGPGQLRRGACRRRQGRHPARRRRPGRPVDRQRRSEGQAQRAGRAEPIAGLKAPLVPSTLGGRRLEPALSLSKG